MTPRAPTLEPVRFWLACALLAVSVGWIAIDQVASAEARTLPARVERANDSTPRWMAKVIAAERDAVATAADAGKKTTAKKAAKKTPTGKLNLNTATAKELSTLPGVGPAKAERVVAWRAKNGKFERVLDLRRVKGFGKKSVEKLEPHLSVSGASTYKLQ